MACSAKQSQSKKPMKAKQAQRKSKRKRKAKRVQCSAVQCAGSPCPVRQCGLCVPLWAALLCCCRFLRFLCAHAEGLFQSRSHPRAQFGEQSHCPCRPPILARAHMLSFYGVGTSAENPAGCPLPPPPPSPMPRPGSHTNTPRPNPTPLHTLVRLHASKARSSAHWWQVLQRRGRRGRADVLGAVGVYDWECDGQDEEVLRVLSRRSSGGGA